jgi:hypothetical protein
MFLQDCLFKLRRDYSSRLETTFAIRLRIYSEAVLS